MKRTNWKESETQSENNNGDSVKSTSNTKAKKTSAKSKESARGFSSLVSLLLLIPGLFAVSFLLTDSFTFGIDPHALLTRIVPVSVTAFFHSTTAATPAAFATSAPVTTPTSPNDIHKTSGGSGGKRKLVTLTEAELRQYDGSDPAKPVYVAINGKVYDVTAGKKHYGKA
ncbi:hypothetical protein HK100_012485 [Physocladia obscura]|uniref:Cytochrome b5 heme-binding domain-containing protein n=1 Tax=Physocladia obscura TaxID=109957 RepID=A0AAD5XK09_9FUNG|nr:hypothetical protein HK100_012485 [Physocladia obscura]